MDLNRLLETGNRCIHDEPPVCAACCPVHMDVTAFIEELKKGDFKKAYKIMEKKIPFARIIGSICDHPCEKVCVRKNAGGTIRISELEKAVVEYGYSPPKKALPLPKNAGKVAVIGGGISGITAAFDLDRKGFQVTIYEKTGKLGGRIWDYEGEVLKKECIEEELQVLEKQGINIKYHTTIGKKELDDIAGEYDAVFLGTGIWEGPLNMDPSTFQLGDSRVFAGGQLADRSPSVIFSASSGRRAALSIERYLKKISITAAREREGVFETSLKYNVDDVEPVAPIQKSTLVFGEDEAVEEANRCLACQCNECMKTCSNMQRFNLDPKNYTRQINNNENVIMGTRYANKMINSCVLCGLCKERCHLGISMKDIIQETRESMVEKGKMPPSAHDFALKDMVFSNSDRFFMVKSPPPIPKEKRKERERELFTYPRISFSKYAQSVYTGDTPGTEKVDFLFYPGCQLSASYPEYVEKTYEYLLSKIKEGTGLMLGCCGAPADWAGRCDLMLETVQRLKSNWLKMGKPVFILACSSCFKIFEKYLPDVPCVSLWEIFERYGLPEKPLINKGQVLNVHDACSTRHVGKIHESIRSIASTLGYEIKELKYTKDMTKCCGYGGLVYYANREQSGDFIRGRTSESKDDLLVYCAMCKDLFVDGGKRTYHILDLIFGEDMNSIALKKMPTLSERHKNRVHLKNKLLREVWGEKPDMDNAANYDFKLIIPAEVRELMEARYILIEDIEQVIDNARKKKERFYNPDDSTYLARMKIDNITYWVKYEENGDEILVKSVYSHRMEVVEE